MRRIIGIILAVVMLCGVVACSSIEEWDIGKYLGSIQVYASESENTTYVEGNIMAVFYTKAEEIVLFWCTNAQIIDNGDGTWDVESPQIGASGVSQELATYGLYKYTSIPQPSPGTIIYLADLDLQAITWEDLPQSMHVAALKSVAVIDGSPRGTVYRLFMGVAYEIPNVRVSQSAYDAYTSAPAKLKVYNPSYSWQAPENKDCFVLVYFISETPYGDEVQIPVIIDKVIK